MYRSSIYVSVDLLHTCTLCGGALRRLLALVCVFRNLPLPIIVYVCMHMYIVLECTEG